nr:penicillin-binding protein 1C [Desulfosalsimonas propionicica]
MLTLVLAAACLVTIDCLAPVDLTPEPGAQVVVNAHGEPLRRFADERGVWRYPVDPTNVSPNYIEFLLTYEDRWFYDHPGVNPLSMVRAFGQWLRHGEIVSGGSTLTMQTARLRYPGSYGWSGKLVQIVRALQIDWHYTKAEILEYYLNHAPFGGTLEGVETASRGYFGHSADLLTDAQAALLAGLPQAPSRYRPDRHPERARAQRDKILHRMETYGVLSRKARMRAQQEPVIADVPANPLEAPLLARRLAKRFPGDARLDTFIDSDAQRSLEQLASDTRSRLPAGASIAMMAMEHGTGRVIAYIGSAQFVDEDRFGHVDMITALRSPGSALKPFIYGLALEAGMIHSESLLMDVPLKFGDYRPLNFRRGFTGAVSMAEALQQSLNVPAVQVLEQLDPRSFYARLQSAGAGLRLPDGAGPSLAIALGGISINLERLIGLYSALGNSGDVLVPRLCPRDPVVSKPLLTPAASWIIRQTLLQGDRKNRNSRPLAIKTGTSSAFRDTWALAVTEHHTLGVWVGHPGNAAMAGHHGRLTAVPLLRAMAGRMPPGEHTAHCRPDNVTVRAICWPTGKPETDLCDQSRTAWIIDGRTPLTLMSTKDQTPQNARPWLRFQVAADSNLRAGPGCLEQIRTRRIPLWPDSLQNWIPSAWRTHERLPGLDPRCKLAKNLLPPTPLRIQGLSQGFQFKQHPATREQPQISVHAVGGQPDWYWFLNGELLPERGPGLTLSLPPPGYHQLSVTDQSGQNDHVNFVVEPD